MDLTIKGFSQLSGGLVSEIADALALANATNPDSSIDSLVSDLRSLNANLTTFAVETQKDEIISSDLINRFYVGVLTDLFVLCGKLKEIELTHTSIENNIKSRVDSLDAAIKELTSRYRELKYLDDHIYSLEVFDQTLSVNKATEYPARYSEVDGTIELASTASRRIDNPAKISITTLGMSGKPNSLAGFQKENMFDESYFSAWFQVVGRDEDKVMYIDPLSNEVEIALAGVTQGPTVTGVASRTVPTNGKVFSVGDKITIGDPRSKYKEEVIIQEASGEYIVIPKTIPELQVSGQDIPHYGYEPIRKGHSLKQIRGVVSVITLEYNYLQQFNRVRVYPFATKAMRLLGIQYYDRGWKAVENTTVLLDSEKSISFDRVITNKVRVLLSQENGQLSKYVVSVADLNSEIAWDKIYETEFKTKASSIEEQLKTFDKNQQTKAKLEGYTAFLARQNDYVATDTANNQLVASAAEETAAILNSVKQFTGLDSDTSTTAVTRFIYDMGLAELEFSLTEYMPFSNYEGIEETPSRNFDLIDLLADEIHPSGYNSCILHSVKLADGKTVALPNRANLNGNGLVEVRNEILELDDNGRATLRFTPLSSTVDVRQYSTVKGSVSWIRNVRVGTPLSNRQLQISKRGIEKNKDVFMVTYTLKEPDTYIKSNVVANITTDRLKGTNKDRIAYMMKAPYLEPFIINSRYTSANIPYFKRIKYRTAWKYVNFQPTILGEHDGFPDDGTVIDNIYYGPAGTSAIRRTSILEQKLRMIFVNQSVDADIAVDRFFNKYANTILAKNLVYEPLQVTIDGKDAYNLTEYGQYYDSAMLSDVPLTNQYKHWEDMLMFMDLVPETSDIRVVYSYKETTLQYVAELNNNLKSNFWVTPNLKSVLLATRIV